MTTENYFENAFEGIYEFDNEPLFEARKKQNEGKVAEAITNYNQIIKNYEEKLQEIYHMRSLASISLTPTFLKKENFPEYYTTARKPEYIKLSIKKEEFKAKLYLVKAMINELEENDSKENLILSLKHYRNLAEILECWGVNYLGKINFTDKIVNSLESRIYD